MSVYSLLLQCRIESIEFTSKNVILNLPANDCTDMSGAIALATSINPNVSFIGTKQAGFPDTHYEKNDAGEWNAGQVDLSAGRRRRGNREQQ